MTTASTGKAAALKEHLEGRVLSLKPVSKRRGVDAWFPYYAGYSAELVLQTLLGLGAKPDWTVLDPWNGSGTTTSVADSLGCKALGFDINPVAAMVAAARLVRTEDASHSAGLADEFIVVASRQPQPAGVDDPLRTWLSPRLVSRFRSIERAILDLLGSRAGVRVDLSIDAPPPFAAFFLLCLIRAAKHFTRPKGNSNPTWILPESVGDAGPDQLDGMFLAVIQSSVSDASDDSILRPSSRLSRSKCLLADSRSLPLPDDSVDAVITSPPYCTRIDYFRATAFELAALGISPANDRFLQLRAMAMGTNLVRRDWHLEIDLLPREVRDLLVNIRKHPSKASGTYYYRNFAQYFDDARRSLTELRRVLKPNATAIIVVQSSYYKNLPIPLGRLFCSLASNIGLEPCLLLQVPVRRVLATINSRANRHEPRRVYSEDVVALQRAA